MDLWSRWQNRGFYVILCYFQPKKSVGGFHNPGTWIKNFNV